MQITRLHIANFRSIQNLDIELGNTSVFIGPNNAGKTAILDAVRIVLTRRWGQRGTGFTEHDVHRPDQGGDPRTLPPVTIILTFEEPGTGAWDADMVAALDDIMAVTPDGRSILTLRVTCSWNVETETFDPVWQFLDTGGQPMPERRRSINLTGFFGYVPIFWLGALRDAADEFTPRSGNWRRLLKSVRIPDALEGEALRILGELDARIVAADPRLNRIADQIGEATRIAVGEGPGAARVNTLPLAIEDMLQRTGVVMRNEELRPWLPLSHHGQGLQSLAVIFLFQAAVLQQLAESDRPGVEAVFAIEEPEAHLHPQAARTLWDRVQGLSGQKLMTTHSPYFVQHVPLRDLRIVRLRGGQTEIASLPRHVLSGLPWNESLDGFVRGAPGEVFFRDIATSQVAARSWFPESMSESLTKLYRRDADAAAKADAIARLRHNCRMLPTPEDEAELGFHCRRVRGEIFFARHWILVEGVTEYLLVHAMGKAFEWSLDAHGVAVIDFQQSGSAGLAHGHAGGKKPALPKLDNVPIIYRSPVEKRPNGADQNDPEFSSITQLLSSGALNPPPADASARTPALIRHTASLLRSRNRKNEYGILLPREAGGLDVRVSEGMLERALQVMSQILAVLERQGFSVEVSEGRTSAVINGERVCFGIEEPVRKVVTQKARVPNPTDRRDYDELVTHEPAGKLVLAIQASTWQKYEQRMRWSDAKVQRLENIVGDFVAGLMRTAVVIRRQEDERKQREAEQERRAREAEQLRKDIQEEEKKLEQLNEWVESWERAERLRRFIAAYAEKSLSWPAEKQPKYKAWIEWATKQADRLDPFVSEKPTSVLDRKHELRSW